MSRVTKSKRHYTNEHMMYESKVTSKEERNAGGNYNQLSLARVCEKLVSGDTYQDVADSEQFTYIDECDCYATWASALPMRYGVRPYIAVE